VEIVPLLVLCSVALAAMAVAFFLYTARTGDHEHADRLALLPLDRDWAETPAQADEARCVDGAENSAAAPRS
jgi:hypothetical protein